jgi:enoyl-CoA hydratase/carnithine racemase
MAPGLQVTRPAAGVVLLSLDRPARANALDPALQTELATAFEALGDDASARCVILTGGPLVFSAGGDVNAMVGCSPIELMRRHTERIWDPITRCPLPVIAAVQGCAYGGGAELALLCDIVLAGEGARFALPEVRLGIMPGIGGTQRLVRAVGKVQAMRLLLTGQSVDARQALAIGMVAEVWPDGALAGAALALARSIAAMPPLAVRQIKEVVLAGMEAPLDTALMLERKAAQLLFASHDQKEGMQAFLDKRPPQFEGR